METITKRISSCSAMNTPSLAESSGDQSCLYRRETDLGSKLQCPVRPDEVAMAAKQLERIFQTSLPSCMAYRTPKYA